MGTLTGLDRLLDAFRHLLAGKRVGLLSHPASVNRQLRHAVSLLASDPEIRLAAIFGPQHGARGETQDNMIEWEGYKDAETGLPVYSLYGEARKPTPEMLSQVDVLVVDLQDVGARYYTFIYTMALAMEACGEADKELVVLDRPNPIGGYRWEGPVLDPAFASFVGLYPLPIRHGMTAGELALYFRDQCGVRCRLEVVPMTGWNARPDFDETGLPWVPPSPNIPRLESALVYPGLCLLEGTNVSEGRGTTLPFEISGAPWIDPGVLVRRMEEMELPGVRYRPVYFQPTFHKWANHLCGGLQLYVTDRSEFKPFLTGLVLTYLYRELGRDWFQWKQPPYEYEYRLLPFDILCGTDRVRLMLEAGASPREWEASWQTELAAFAEVRKRYLLYPPA